MDTIFPIWGLEFTHIISYKSEYMHANAIACQIQESESIAIIYASHHVQYHSRPMTCARWYNPHCDYQPHFIFVTFSMRWEKLFTNYVGYSIGEGDSWISL